MRRLLFGLLLSALPVAAASAQSLDDLNIQIHGYATQGFLATTQNNILTTNSSDGSAGWTEAVVNVTAQPNPKLRIGVQGRYFVLGNFGNEITLDWAAADYKVNDKFGVRFGKVKTPTGLFNEIQDIDPSYLWSLLPQGNYPISSRNSILSHFGGVVYGTLNLGSGLGKAEYRGWAGERTISGNDGYYISFKEAGIQLPNGVSDTVYGGAIHWKTPVHGLMLGASNNHSNRSNTMLTVDNGAYSGTQYISPFNTFQLFSQYEMGRFTLSGEYQRLFVNGLMYVHNIMNNPIGADERPWYAMASYKATSKLSTGIYCHQSFDHHAALGPARFTKDWALSARYDFSPFVYAKAEEHFLDGTGSLYDATLNPGGLKPDTKLTVLKLGVSF